MSYFKFKETLLSHLLVLISLCGILYFPYLARIPFFNKGEPREALVVQAIFQHGNWLFPLKSGEEIPSKPPLFHWFGALTSVVFGRVTEATVRFPSAVFATLGVLILYVLGRRVFDPESAFFAGIILATSAGYETHAVSARVDMTLTFFITLALVLFYLLYQGLLTRQLWFYAFYLVLGLGILAKGPLGLILPTMVICIFLGLRKRWDFLFRLCLHKGALLTLMIGASWYGIALMRGGEDFFNRQIIHENLARFFVHGEGGSGHQKPIYYYFPYLVLEGLPWTLFLPFAIVKWFKSKAFAEDRSLFLGLWAGLFFVFFSVSVGKRSAYLLPLYPPLSLLIGSWLRQPAEKGIRAIGLKIIGWAFLLVGLVPLVILVSILMGKHLSWFFSYVNVWLKPKDQVQLSVALEALGRAGWLLYLFFFVSALLWISTGRSLFTVRTRVATAQVACLSILVWFLVQGALMPSLAEARSYKAFMTKVNGLVDHNETFFVYGEGWDYASVIFYSGARIPVVKGDLLSLQDRIRKSKSYCIMSEREWNRMADLGLFAFHAELRSEGTGPDGRDPIVLVRAP
jgi:4-amino-4-deoxy-L-arabinose transferase-like glycosyltransferase